MTAADRLAEALRALLADPANRERAQAELERYDAEKNRRDQYRDLAARVK